MTVGFHPDAYAEFRAAALYYESRVVGLGGEFISEVEQIVALLEEFPTLGVRMDAVHRRLPLRRFPFALIYRSDLPGTCVVAVAHDRRRPGYWQSRD